MNKLKKYIPPSLKPLAMMSYIFTRCLLRGLPAKEIRLNLAGVLPEPGSPEIVHGGKVKLMHLREHFGDTWQRFNIAYFVSSGLPFSPKWWVKIYKLFGIKIVWNQNGVAYPALYPEPVVTRVNSLMKSIHQSHYVMYQTEFVKKCADKYLGKFSGQSSIVYNPIDIEHYIPRPQPLPIDTLVLLTTINHSSIERMTIAIQTVRRLHDHGIKTKLIILGDIKKAGWPTAAEDIYQEIKKHHLEIWVELKGGYLQKDAPALFQAAHIMIHLKYLDPCPTLVLEALACGLPVIGSASGGMPEMVDEKSGILIPIEENFDELLYPSVDQVVEAVGKIYPNLDEYSRGARAQALNEKFRKDVWIAKHEEIFRKLWPQSQ